MKRFRHLSILAAAALAMSACGDSDDTENDVPTSLDAGHGTPDAGYIQLDSGNIYMEDEETDPTNWWEEEEGHGGNWWEDPAQPDDAGVPWSFTDSQKALNDESEETGVRANFSPALIIPSGDKGGTPAQFLAFPFPADHRRNADGTVRFDDFPRPDSLAQTVANKLLDRYLSIEGGVDGFSLNGAVHVSFDGALELSAVPTDPGAFLDADAVFKIIDIDPNSPERGRVRPLRWEWQAQEGSYAAANSLAIAPSWGFPLREANKYALVILKDGLKGADGSDVRQPLLLSALLANRAEKPEGLTDVEDDLYEKLRTSYAPLRETLAYKGIAINDVAVATVFTTQGVTQDLRRIAANMSGDLNRGTWVPKATYSTTDISYWGSICSRTNAADTWATCSWKWNSSSTAKLYQLAATFNSRNYQQGTVPYLYEGGNFQFNYQGVPKYRDETLTLMVTIPEMPITGDDGCIPIVEIAHGTGGDAYSGLGDRTSLRLAGRGIATVGMDQPLHGDRFDVENYQIPSDGIMGLLLQLAGVQAIDSDTLLSLVNFNFLNMDAARSCIRQSAIDTMALTHLIKSGGLDVPAEYSPTGKPITFCKDKIGFFGHSQGALSGAVAAGMEHTVGGWLLSAGGGGLGITILDRKDFGDFPSLLGMLFSLKASAGETLTEQHILMTIMQTMVDATDPINYAPYWSKELRYGAPTSQLLTSGLNDSETPARSARALSYAANLTPVKPLVADMPELTWAGLTPVNAPMSGNGPDGKTTNAFIQWDASGDYESYCSAPDTDCWSGHFLVYHRPEATNASMKFLRTYFDPGTSGTAPLIERDVGADVKASPVISLFAPVPYADAE